MKDFKQLLKDKGFYSGAIDGLIGPLSLAGAKQYIDSEMRPVIGKP